MESSLENKPLVMRQRIREFRIRRGMTQSELAEKVGTTAATVSRLETNMMTVSTEWLERFAQVLGVHPAELIERPGSGAIKLIGNAGRGGRVTPMEPLEFRLDPPGEAVAVEVTEAQGPYVPGDRLVGERLTGANALHGAGRDCIVALKDGAIMLARLAGAPPKATLVPLATGAPVLYDAAIDWIAPIVMRVQFLP